MRVYHLKKIPEIGAMPEIFGLSRRARLDSRYNMKLLEGIDRFQARDHFTIGRHIGAHVNSELVSREL